MNKMRIEKGDWLVVCDGRKALILENLGDEMFPNLHTREVHEQPNPSTAAQGSDAPGRLHSAVGGSRSSVEQTDWHDEAERAFLRGLAGRLDAAVSSGETKALTMVASPRALGMIRADYSETVRKGAPGGGRQPPRSHGSRRPDAGRAQPSRRPRRRRRDLRPAPRQPTGTRRRRGRTRPGAARRPARPGRRQLPCSSGPARPRPRPTAGRPGG